MKNKIIISVCLLAILGLFSGLGLLYAQTQNFPVQGDYVLSPGDLLEINVYGEPDLSTHVRISEDGNIRLPLLGSIKAIGLTARELEERIRRLLADDYLINPQVSIFIQEYAKIYIMGRVFQPGSYELKGRLTLTSAIALAGGFQDTGDPTNVKLIRTIMGERQTIEINVDRITSNLTPDVELRPNDTIVVEEYGRISIIGQVNAAGTYVLKKNLTLLEAIGLAGGFTDVAAIDGTSVIRKEGGKKRIIRIRVSDITKRGDKSKDILLMPGDTIVVPESFF